MRLVHIGGGRWIVATPSRRTGPHLRGPAMASACIAARETSMPLMSFSVARRTPCEGRLSNMLQPWESTAPDQRLARTWVVSDVAHSWLLHTRLRDCNSKHRTNKKKGCVALRLASEPGDAWRLVPGAFSGPVFQTESPHTRAQLGEDSGGQDDGVSDRQQNPDGEGSPRHLHRACAGMLCPKRPL